MIDPVTAIAAATTAYKTVVAMVNAGRELEDTLGALGKWYGAASDLARADQQRRNPPLFSRIIHSKSIEQEALDILIHKKKLQEQEMELRTLLNWRFGLNCWEELIELRRKIRKEREDTIYRQMERRKAFFENSLLVFLVLTLFGIVGTMVYYMGQATGKW